ncbi:MAG: inositol-3-phosphate synthase [Desulfobacteraceae bacterium]|nr:inositol-3-phosphate synthase [Desulfobacteraceae bacterium]
MKTPNTNSDPSLLILVAGIKGAIGTTLSLAVAAMRNRDASILNSLTTAAKFANLGDPFQVQIAGWDTHADSIAEAIQRHGVVPESYWCPHAPFLSHVEIGAAPPDNISLADQVEVIKQDMRLYMAHYPTAQPVLVNLLPAAWDVTQLHRMESLEELLKMKTPGIPDLAYALSALLLGIPIVNFTPNSIELPLICHEALQRGVPLAGRDGKTGQTFFKVVLASAFKSRALYVDGWYSLNILGNADGKNLMDPDRACGKLHNKTSLLDDILDYRVGEHYDESSHKVRIDYYPPRGDAKEAWDVIDFKGLFGLPMSLRLNLQGRDSILAAPMVLDLARWAAALKNANISGPIADLGFFFKKPVGPEPPLTFQDQLAALERLEKQITKRLPGVSEK